jgi:hypothetical protein
VDPHRPLFLYVNFHDTHFPYHHAGIRPIVSPVAVDREDINAARASQLRETYLNTVANVDAAIGDVLEEVRRARRQVPAVVVTSDHGESLFDNGTLGHGLSIEDAQNHVPLVVAGLDVELPDTMGLSEFRGILRAALEGPQATAKPRLRFSGSKSIFVFTGTVVRPAQIGFLGRARSFVIDMRSNTVRQGLQGAAGSAAGDLDKDKTKQFDGLAWTWESVALAQAQLAGER